MSRDEWFASLARGQCFVTNGPLLLVKANDLLPGATLRVEPGKALDVKLEVELTSNDRIARLEIIQNGQILKTLEPSVKVSQQLSATFAIDQPGWFLLRAIADVDQTFRFASTAPWFVESDTTKDRISRRSAQFFLDWVEERIARVKANVSDETERREVLKWHDQARGFWTERVAAANAD
jgi:hypothetical protein